MDIIVKRQTACLNCGGHLFAEDWFENGEHRGLTDRKQEAGIVLPMWVCTTCAGKSRRSIKKQD